MRASLVLALVALVGTTCSDGDEDTLEPLPIEGGTAFPAGADPGPGTPVGRATTPGGLPTPTAEPGTEQSTGTAPPPPPGDWDGARFDVGTIVSVGTTGAYTTIELDRWSYTRPDGGTVDAGGLTEEPVVAWWRTSPFSNLRVELRTFVLAPDVEVLTLDPDGRAPACADPPPRTAPRPRWERTGTSQLGRATEDGTFATLTYGDTGLVTRIRLTRGC